MSNTNVSAVIQTFQRPSVLPEQIKALEDQSHCLDEIIISHVRNEKTSDFDWCGYRYVGYDGFNNPWGRYVSATCCPENTDFIFFLDDDCIPGTEFVEFALKYYNKKEGVWAGRGEYATATRNRKYDGFFPREHKSNHPAIVDWCGGHCTLLPYEYLNIIISKKPPFDLFSGRDDIWIGYLLEQNGIDRFITPYPEGDQSKWGVRKLKKNDAEMAIHNSYDNHTNERTKLIEWMFDHGFEPIDFESSNKATRDNPVFIDI